MNRHLQKMNKDNKKWYRKLLGFSPWLLGSACILLLLVIAFFAVSNYDREKNLITKGLEQKGLTLVRFINSAVGNSVRSTIMKSSSYKQWETHMQPALDLAAEQPGVDSIVLVDKNANVLLSAPSDALIAHGIGAEFLELVKELDNGEITPWRTRIIKSSVTGESKAIIAIKYVPPGPEFRGKGNNHQRMPGGWFRHSHHFETFRDDMRRVGALAPVYFVQLDSTEFTTPLRRQFIQIVLELAAIFLVGLGGTLSFFTLRGLKGSEKTIGKLKIFNEVLVSSLPVGLIATDENGAIQVMNDAAEKMTSLFADDVIGQQPEQVLPLKFVEILGGRRQHGNMKRREGRVAVETYLNGYALDVNVVPVAPAKGILGGEVMLLRDITEVKRLEGELQRSERLAVIGKMAAGVAHELRNPLSSIKGLTLLLKSKLGEESDSENTADTLVREVERLNRSIGELLDYAKPGSLMLESCQISSILEKTLLLLEPDIASYGVKVGKNIADGLPDVLADKDKISQVLLNVLLNSLQAMEEIRGQRILNVDTKKEGGYIVLSISDNGCGIAAENLHKIFDPYYTSKSSGTGLGLALSLKIVEEHGGKLLVSSIPGEKTEFQLYLRLA